MRTIDLTNASGNDLSNIITDSSKFKIFIKSKPYNKYGAYYAFESHTICNTDNLYTKLANNESLKNSYCLYFNYDKEDYEKTLYDMPDYITPDDIESIQITELPLNYIEYYNT